MSRLRSIWLVARREIIERGRSRGFVFSVLFTTALVVASIVVPPLLFGDDDPTPVGLVEPVPAGLEASLAATAAQLDMELDLTTFPDVASGDAALTAEDDAVRVDAVVIVPADLSSSGEVRFAEDADDGLVSIISLGVSTLRAQAVLTEAGVDPAELAAVQVPPTVTELQPSTEDQEGQFLLANIGAVLILVGIFSFGFTVLTGVVEEKQSRVVEVVLSTVRPKDLLIGKVLGIGILGLVQLAIFGVAAVAAASFTGGIPLPSTTPGAVAMLAVWFILGYALYATALGFLGALASRMEEASNASTPVTVVAMVSYFVALFGVTNDPNGVVATVATYLPPSAPFVVPLRVAFDAIGPVEIGLAMLSTIIGIYVLFTIGARVYAGAVLQTAGRMKLRDAWRSAGE
jgi:ABC-2 type transport system permease protein